MDIRYIETLYKISSQVGRTDDPALALQTILADVIQTLGGVSGSVALLNPDSGRLELEVHQGLPSDTRDLQLKLGQGVTGWVAFHGRPVLVPDVSIDPRYISVNPVVRCEMAAPMEDNGQVIGVVNIDSDKVGGFSEEDLDKLASFTAEATIVVQRLWLIRHLKDKGRQLETLITIGQSLVSKVEEQELYDTVTRQARAILHVRVCALYLYQKETQSVRVASITVPSDFPADGLPSRVPIRVELCLTASVIHTKKPAEYLNIQNPEFYDVVDLPREKSLRSVLATPMAYEGEVIGALVIFTDRLHRFNNDEKRLLSALASLAAVAIQNSRLYARVFNSEDSLRKNEKLTTLGLLAAEIAHEIRNPLTVIKLLFGTLGLEFSSDDPRTTDVRVISEKLDQLEAIVTRVLNFAKAPSSLHSRWSISDIVDDTAVLVRLKLAQSKIQLQCIAAPQPMVVDGNKGQLQQVLLNLILNSTQAMPAGGTITISSQIIDRKGARFVAIDLTDTGTGIPDSIRERIFDSFLSGRADGTGLGLAIVKRILSAHHGDIHVLMTSPQGTTMRILMPLAQHA